MGRGRRKSYHTNAKNIQFTAHIKSLASVSFRQSDKSEYYIIKDDSETCYMLFAADEGERLSKRLSYHGDKYSDLGEDMPASEIVSIEINGYVNAVKGGVFLVAEKMTIRTIFETDGVVKNVVAFDLTAKRKDAEEFGNYDELSKDTWGVIADEKIPY